MDTVSYRQSPSLFVLSSVSSQVGVSMVFGYLPSHLFPGHRWLFHFVAPVHWAWLGSSYRTRQGHGDRCHDGVLRCLLRCAGQGFRCALG